MKKLLTDLSVQQLKWNGKHTVYFHEKIPAFGVRVGQRTKTFIVVRGKERIATTIGHYPDMSLKDAIQKARMLIYTEDVPMSSKSYSVVKEAFLKAVASRVKKGTLEQYKSYLDALDFDKRLCDITRGDINEKLQIYDGKPWSQNYAYASLRVFFNWCLEQEYLDKHPLIKGRPPNKTKSRERVLSDEELGRIWRCTTDNDYGRILRILMLHGQRRMEVRNLKPEDVADGLITYHTKGDKINVLPVTPLVQQNLTLPFKFNNWGDAKAAFDADCGVSFRHHDLRRTLATKLAQKGVDFIVIERILGHAQTGVAFVYNRHSYLPQIKTALEMYETHIRKCAGIRYTIAA